MNFKIAAILLLTLGGTEAIRITTFSGSLGDTAVVADPGADFGSDIEGIPEAKSFVGLDSEVQFHHKHVQSHVAKAGPPHFAFSLSHCEHGKKCISDARH